MSWVLDNFNVFIIICALLWMTVIFEGTNLVPESDPSVHDGPAARLITCGF